jgi:predicted RNA-binding protein YlxR (DUF448 family)
MAKLATRRGPRPKHIPERTCVGCATVTVKRGLVRIVRQPDGEVRPDPTGKAPGRGAYLHADRACWETAFKKKQLERSLNLSLTASSREALVAYAATLPEETPE